MASTRIYGGLDLGQRRDFSVLVALERGETTDVITEKTVGDYCVVGFRRWALSTPYTAIVGELAGIITRKMPHCWLAVDAGHAGLAVLDNLRAARPPCTIKPITVTAGRVINVSGAGYCVPKKELIGTLRHVLESGRLKVPASIAGRDVLKAELEAFTEKQKPSGAETFEGQGEHDDSVAALMLAVWLAERFPPVNYGLPRVVGGRTVGEMRPVWDGSRTQWIPAARLT